MSKLTKQQYDELVEQFDRLPDISTSYSNSGEHYILMGMLNKIGFYPGSREEAVKTAERLLNDYTAR